MTRDHFSIALIICAFAFLVYKPDAISLCAFAAALLAYLGLVLLPLVYSPEAETLRKDLSAIVAAQSADIDQLKSRLDQLTLRGAR